MDGRLSALSEKVNETQSTVEKMSSPPARKMNEVGAVPHPSHAAGGDAEAPAAKSDPELGFAHDAAVSSFRQAMVIFKARKYPEAMLAFSAFLERYADHPLAGSAQFYVGESYFQQKEYKLAVQEFTRLLSAYDRSPHLADTLRDLAIAEDQTQQPNEAAKHRELLSSLFPQSPAAQPAAAPVAKPQTQPAGETHAQAAPVATQAHLDPPPVTAPPTAPVQAEEQPTEGSQGQ